MLLVISIYSLCKVSISLVKLCILLFFSTTLWIKSKVLPKSRQTKESILSGKPSATLRYVTDSLASELKRLEAAIPKWAGVQSKEEFKEFIEEIKQQYEQFFKARFYFVSRIYL
jgi:hypothetical protein